MVFCIILLLVLNVSNNINSGVDAQLTNTMIQQESSSNEVKIGKGRKTEQLRMRKTHIIRYEKKNPLAIIKYALGILFGCIASLVIGAFVFEITAALISKLLWSHFTFPLTTWFNGIIVAV